MFHRPLYWRSQRNSPLDVHHKKTAGTRVHSWRSQRRAKFGVAGKVLVPSMQEQSQHFTLTSLSFMVSTA
jgi:hypothetical protein